jgi:hypothetical protein
VMPTVKELVLLSKANSAIDCVPTPVVAKEDRSRVSVFPPLMVIVRVLFALKAETAKV